jgi:hypothetical protein
MPPTARPIREHTAHARARLQDLGGPDQLPDVLSSRDVIPLFGRNTFMELLQRKQLPGIQVVPAGVWRCLRATFVEWLEEHSL